MRNTYEPLKKMNIAAEENSLYIAISIAMLLPLADNRDVFEEAFADLFGDSNMRTQRKSLREGFQAMSDHQPPLILSDLIRDYLIPKFTAYCNDNGHGLKAGDNESQDYLFILKAIEGMLNVTLQRHDTTGMVVVESSLCRAYPEPGQSLHVLEQADGWQPLLDASKLPVTLRAYFSPATLISPYCPAFEGMVQSGMQVTLDSLRSLSISSPQTRPPLLTSRTIVFSGQGALPSGMHDLSVRYNSLDTITNAVQSDVTQVNLSTEKKYPEPWEYAELVGAGGGALAGVGVAGAIELGVELGFGLIAGTLLYIEAVPLAVLITLVGAGVGVAGKKASREYCTALVTATEHLKDRRYDDAARVLDEQFAAWAITQWVRSGFLSYEHQAVAHIYRAICEEAKEGSSTANRAIAYNHYTQAATYAKLANREFLHFISDLCRLKLLKKSTPQQLGFKDHEKDKELAASVAHQSAFDTILERLMKDYNAAFEDLYSKLNHNMLTLIQVFSSRGPIVPAAVTAANAFLTFDDFYMLQHVKEGRGPFIDVLGLCVQAALLAKLHQTHPGEGLEIQTKNQLLMKFPDCTENANLNLALACEKLREAAELLSHLKHQYAEQIEADQSLKRGLVCIEDFILRFHAHCFKKGEFFEHAYQEIIKKLAVPEARAEQILALAQYTIELLNNIEKNFSNRLLSLEAWLQALTQPINPLRDRVDLNGDTMLHWLTRIPFIDGGSIQPLITEAVNLLKHQAYVRNGANETPLFALKENDPYGMAADIFPEFNASDSLKAFGNTYATDLPSPENRKKLLQHRFREKRISDDNIQKIVDSTEGFSSIELEETVTDLATSIVDVNDELATQLVDYCKTKKKPWSSILEDIKQAIWNDCDRYISNKVNYASSLDSYRSQSVSQKNAYKTNVQESLGMVFNDPEFQTLILDYYNPIQDTAIPRVRRKAEYLTSLVALGGRDDARLKALKECCKAVKTHAIQSMGSRFAQLIADYIKSAWAAVSPKQGITSSNVVFFRPTAEATVENAEKQKFNIIDTKMKIFKTFFVHYLDKTSRLFAVLTQEAVSRKKDDVLHSFSDMIRSTEVKVGINMPFVGSIDANISQVIAGIIDLFQMANEFLDKRKMQMLCNCFPENETQRFDVVMSAALKLSVELSPELYHMPDEAIRELAELIVTRIVRYMTQSEHNTHETYPGFIERTFIDAQSMFSTKISSSPAKRKDLITLCQDGMRAPRGNAELSKVSKKVSPNQKDSPTYQDILDNYGKIVVQENGETVFIKPKSGQAYCMAQSSKEKSSPQTDTSLPSRLRDILSTCVNVYSAEMGNSNPIIPDNIFSDRRQQSLGQKSISF